MDMDGIALLTEVAIYSNLDTLIISFWELLKVEIIHNWPSNEFNLNLIEPSG